MMGHVSTPPFVRRMALRAFDFSERGLRWGVRDQQERGSRWWRRFPFIVQCALTGGVAWAIATYLLGHPQAVFAPIAAVICIGLNYGERLTRSVEIGLGVIVGVGLGDLFVYLFGTGVWQIVVMVLVAMSVATWLGAGTLITIQAAVQSMVVMTLLQTGEAGFTRIIDAFVGVLCALAVTLLLPAASLNRPRREAARVLREAAGALDEVYRALAEDDLEIGRKVLARVRRSESLMAPLRSATTEGLAAARVSAVHRHRRGRLEELSALVGPLDRMLRNQRVLVRRCTVAIWRDEPVPLTYRHLLRELAEALRSCAQEFDAGRIPSSVIPQLTAMAQRSSHLPISRTMSAVVLLAQMRSMMVDLLELCGMDSADAHETVPDME